MAKNQNFDRENDGKSQVGGERLGVRRGGKPNANLYTNSWDFPLMLSDWAEHEHCATPKELFEKIGLAPDATEENAPLITLQQFEEAYYGRAALGPICARLISLHLPGSALWLEESIAKESIDDHMDRVNDFQRSSLTPRNFQKMAEEFRYFKQKENERFPVIEISSQKLSTFRFRTLKRIGEQNQAVLEAQEIVDQTAMPAQNTALSIDPQALKERILSRLQNIAGKKRYDGISDEQMLKTLTNQFANTPEAAVTGVMNLLGNTVTKNEVQRFFQYLAHPNLPLSSPQPAPPHKKPLSVKQAIDLIRQLNDRSSKGVDVAVNLLLSRDSNLTSLEAHIKTLGLSKEEALQVLILSNPRLTEGKGIGFAWAEECYDRGDWDSLLNPGLNAKWLAAQEESKRAAYILQALRRKSGLTQMELAKAIGWDNSYNNPVGMISKRERGHTNIEPTLLDKFIKALHPSKEHALAFVAAVNPSITLGTKEGKPLWPAWGEKQFDAEKLSAFSNSALEPEWLAAQAPEAQLSLLLRGLCQRKGVAIDAFAKEMDVGVDAAGEWLRGTVMEVQRLSRLLEVLDPPVESAVQLIALVNPSIVQGSWQKNRPWSQWAKDKLAQGEKKIFSAPGLDSEWLKRQAPDKRPGLMLNALREDKRLTREELEGLIGDGGSMVGVWERGVNPINPRRLGKLLEVLKPSRPKALEFIKLVAPEIAKNGRGINSIWPAWAEARLDAGNYSAFSYPAYDKEWLETQNPKIRAGLLLRSLRNEKGLSLEQLARGIGLREKENQWVIVRGWETGRIIRPGKLGELLRELTPSWEKTLMFIKAARPRLIENKADEEWLKDRCEKGRWTDISYAELDDGWLKNRPSYKQAGLLLQGYFRRSKLQIEQVKETLGLPKETFGKWVRGEAPIPEEQVTPLALVLSLAPEESERLGRLIKDRKIRAGLLLRTMREKRDLSQEKLAEAIGVQRYTTVSTWERGGTIDAFKLGELIRELKPAPEVAMEFIELVNPNLFNWNVFDGGTEAGYAWVREQLKSKNYNALSYSALDTQWLAGQEPSERGDLWLHAWQREQGITFETLAQKTGIAKFALGSGRIKSNEVGTLVRKLVEEYGLSRPRSLQLIAAVRPALTRGKHEEKNIWPAWVNEQLNAGNYDVLSYPAFDSQWLLAQEPHRQAGLLLRDLRQEKGMDQIALGKALNVSTTAVGKWEHGDLRIHASWFDKIKETLGSEKRAPQFAQLEHLIEQNKGPYYVKGLQFARTPRLSFARPSSPPAPYKVQGETLSDMRERKKMSKLQLAHAIGVNDPEIITSWEKGMQRIDHGMVGKLIQVLEPPRETTFYFIQTVSPHLFELGSDWISGRLEAHDWDALSCEPSQNNWREQVKSNQKEDLSTKMIR